MPVMFYRNVSNDENDATFIDYEIMIYETTFCITYTSMAKLSFKYYALIIYN